MHHNLRRSKMTVKTGTAFDLDVLRRGYKEWDVEALLALYADELPARSTRQGGVQGHV
jgi:hypothetical protein